MRGPFDDVVGIPCLPEFFDIPSPEDIERARQAEIAKRESDLQDWLLILEFVAPFDDGSSSDIMVYDPRTNSELPLYIVERRTIANLRMMDKEIVKGTAARWSNVLEYCDWYLSAELRDVTHYATIDIYKNGVLEEFDDKFLADFQANYKEAPGEDLQFDIACAQKAFNHMLDAYIYFYETSVLGLLPDVDYEPSPYIKGGKGYRLVK